MHPVLTRSPITEPAKTGSVIGAEPATGRIRHFQNFPFAKITPVLSHCWLFFFYLNCQWNNGCWGKPVTVKIATYQQPWRFKAGWHSGPFTFCRSQPLSHPPVLSSFFCSPSSLLLIPEAIAGISHWAVFTLLNLCEESGGRGTQTNTRRIHKAAAVVHIYMYVYPTGTQDCVRW